MTHIDPRTRLVVFESRPTYEEWCEANGLDPNDDENYNNYSEWRNN